MKTDKILLNTPLYIYENHFLFAKFIGVFQKKGKSKFVSNKLIKKFFTSKKNNYYHFVVFFYEAIDCVRPFLELKSFPGGKIAQVPFELSQKRQIFLAIKYILFSVQNFKKTRGISSYEALFEEILSISNFDSASVKSKQLKYKILFQNKNKIFWRNKMSPTKEILHLQIKYKNDLVSFFYKNLKKNFLIFFVCKVY